VQLGSPETPAIQPNRQCIVYTTCVGRLAAVEMWRGHFSTATGA